MTTAPAACRVSAAHCRRCGTPTARRRATSPTRHRLLPRTRGKGELSEGDRPRPRGRAINAQEPQGFCRSRSIEDHPERSDYRPPLAVSTAAAVDGGFRPPRPPPLDRQVVGSTPGQLKGLRVSVSNGFGVRSQLVDCSYFHTSASPPRRPMKSRHQEPAHEISIFTSSTTASLLGQTELVTMEDLPHPPRPQGRRRARPASTTRRKDPRQIDGRAEVLRHPICASGSAHATTRYPWQFQGVSGARPLQDPRIGMPHNLRRRPTARKTSPASPSSPASSSRCMRHGVIPTQRGTFQAQPRSSGFALRDYQLVT